jgi:hypothetical protein
MCNLLTHVLCAIAIDIRLTFHDECLVSPSGVIAPHVTQPQRLGDLSVLLRMVVRSLSA